MGATTCSSAPATARRRSSSRSSSPPSVRFATTSTRAGPSCGRASDAASRSGRRRSGSLVETSHANAPASAQTNSATPMNGATSAPSTTARTTTTVQPTAMWNASASLRTGLRMSPPRDVVPRRVLRVKSPRGSSSRALGNLLHRPAVPVGILEEHEAAPWEVLHLADRDAARLQLVAGRVGVFDHQLQPLQRARLGRGDARADRNRARGTGRRQLHEPQVLADDVVVVGVEADLVDVEGFGAIDVRDRDGDQLELVVHARLPFRGEREKVTG